MRDSDLRWVGQSNRRVCFCFESDLDLLDQPARSSGNQDDETGFFPQGGGRYDFGTLLKTTGLDSALLAERLWESAFRGRLTNDTYTALRRGLETGFKMPGSAETAPPADRSRRSPGRTRFPKWKTSPPLAGAWLRLPVPEPAEDLIEAEERNKERVRLLLDRYGLLFKELLSKESPAFRWPKLFRTLRLMELSGELLAGVFFQDVPGLQFMSHQAFRRLQRQNRTGQVFWINAADPASLCGLGLEAFKGSLPRRLPGVHLVYRDGRLTLVSERNGRTLTFHDPPDSPDIQHDLAPLKHLLTRGFQRLNRLKIETINGLPAPASPYLDALKTGFEVMVDYQQVVLYQRRS